MAFEPVMRTTQANRYARWAAMIAGVMVLGMVVVYIRHSFQARDAQKNSPPTVPAEVEKSSQTFTYSSGDKDKTLFTVRASTVTVYKDTNRTLLEDVWITIFGRKGDRSDNIHTHSCEYLADPDRFFCAGAVQLDLESAEESRRVSAAPSGSAVKARVVHATTKGVTFDKDSGEATTDQPVEFTFPGGDGKATGVTYRSDSGIMILRKNVEMNLTPAAPSNTLKDPAAAAMAASPVKLTGSRVEFRRESRVMFLDGPVVATQDIHPNQGAQVATTAAATPADPYKRELRAAQLSVDLDKDFHASRVTALGDSNGRSQMRSADAKGSGSVTADQFIADLAPEGWIKKLSAVGNVVGDDKTSTDTNHFTAARVDLDMVPKFNQPKTFNANGGVKIDSTSGSHTRTIETAAMVMDFVPAPPKQPGTRPAYRPGSARTLAPATMISHEQIPGQANSQQRVLRIKGERIETDFSDRSHLRHMEAHGGAEVEQDLPGKLPQTSTSQDLAAEFDTQGQWTTLDQSGNVRLHYADRSGQAAKAHMDRASELATLTGSAEAADAATRTKADSITFNQRTDEMRADGNVLTTYRKPTGTKTDANSGGGMGMSPSLGPDPANIIAEHLVGNSATGHAVYSGHARLWQGDSIMEADEIELNRPTNQLDARGNVRAVFVQVPSAAGTNPLFQSPKSGTGKGSSGAQVVPTDASGAPPKPDVWRIRSGSLTYFDEKSMVHLDKGFTAESQKGSIGGQACDLFFTSMKSPAQSLPNSQSTGLGAAKRLDHAVATGNVIVKQNDRRGTAERADYDAVAGKFILSGGNPTLYDDAGNSTKGRQLTLFLADDTILVESDEGSRTVTRYRVKK